MARCAPIWKVMGAILFAASLSAVSLSSRMSSFVPTRMIGTLGAWWLISGYHCVRVRSCLRPVRLVPTHLGKHVVKRRRADKREANEEDVGLGI
jgi:hypothetical protein